jgi:predicted TIM-barrel fold metal-dependent hydrolase
MFTMPMLIELIFQGVFDRYPGLRIGFIEVGCGWIPHFLEMVDDRYWRNRHWTNTKVKKVPSQYFKDHCLATFITDYNGVSVRHQVGVDNMSWSTDFPHHGNDWPYSRRVVDSLFVNVPEEERHKIVCGNAQRFWNL